ncbi:ring finger protein [Cystoisospora suis]|uniref:Ring finger protein n=1 Tax=Cystoisospora suis TaxID=483139 RepID=A0A2C6L137_9APIC|nr:ring finger protein [Cystoisospora suis]
MTGAVEAPLSHHHELSDCNPCCERSPTGGRRENTEILRNVATRGVVMESIRKRAGVREGETVHGSEATMKTEQHGAGHESREDFMLQNLAEEHSLNGLSSTQVSTASSPSNKDSSQMNHHRHKRRGERQRSVPYWGDGQAGEEEDEGDGSGEGDPDDGSVEGDEDEGSSGGEELKDDGEGSQGDEEEDEEEGDFLVSQFWRGTAANEKKNGQDEEMSSRDSARRVSTRLPAERGEESTRPQEGGSGSRSDSSDSSEEDDEIEAPRRKRRRRLVLARCPDDSTGENDTQEDQNKGANSNEKEKDHLLSRVSGSGFFYSSQDLPSVATSKEPHHASTSSLQTYASGSVSSSGRPNSDEVTSLSHRHSLSEEHQNKSSSASPFSRSRRSPSGAGAAESPPDTSHSFPYLSSSFGKQRSDLAVRESEPISRRAGCCSPDTVLSGSGWRTGREKSPKSDRLESEGEEYQEAREQDDDEEEQTPLQSDTSEETCLRTRRRAGTSDTDREDSVSESSSGEEESDRPSSSRAAETDQEVVNSQASSFSSSSRRSSDSSTPHSSLDSSSCSSSSSSCSSSSSSPPCPSQSSSSSFVSSVFLPCSTVSSSLCSSASATKCFSGRGGFVRCEGRDKKESLSPSFVSASHAKKGGGTLSFISTLCPSLTRVLSGREGDNEGTGEPSQRRGKEGNGDVSKEEKAERSLDNSQGDKSMDNVSRPLVGDPSEPVSYRGHVKGEPSSSSSLRHPRRRPSSTSSLRLNLSSGEQSGNDSESLALTTSGEGGIGTQGEEGRSSNPSSLSGESVEGGERGVHTRGWREGEEGRRRGSSGGGGGEERRNDSLRQGEDEKSGETGGDVEDTGSVLEVASGNEEEAGAISVDSGDEDDDDVSVVRETSAEGEDGRPRSSSPPASFLHSHLVRCFRNPNAAIFLRSHMQEARGRSGSPRPLDEEGRREGERSGDREQAPGDSLEVIAVEEEEEEEAVEVIRVENQQTATNPASLALAQGYFFPSSFPLSMQPTGYMLPFSPGMMMSAARVPAPVERGEEYANVPRCAICLMNLRRRHEEVLRLMEEQEDHEEKASTSAGGETQEGQDERSSSSSPRKETGSEGAKDGRDPTSPGHPDEGNTGNGESRSGGGGGDSSSKGGEQEEETTGEQAGVSMGGEDASSSSSSRPSPPLSGQRRGGGGGGVRGKGGNRRRGGKSDGGTADQKKALTEKFKALYSKDDESQTMVTVCGHAFCQGCLLRALEMKKECPVCRRKLQGPRQFFPVFF